jgi:hypothetical protein
LELLRNQSKAIQIEFGACSGRGLRGSRGFALTEAFAYSEFSNFAADNRGLAGMKASAMRVRPSPNCCAVQIIIEMHVNILLGPSARQEKRKFMENT